MASNGNFNSSNMTADNLQNVQGTSGSFEQVSEFLVYFLWMLLNECNSNLWWHSAVGALQFGRILLTGKLSKIIFVCGLMICSDGWAKILKIRGIIALFITSLGKFCTDLVLTIIKRQQLMMWCEMSLIFITTMHLLCLLIYKHGRDAILWLVIGGSSLSIFTLRILLDDENILLMGIIILMNKWDKVKKTIKCCGDCWNDLVIVTSDAISA